MTAAELSEHLRYVGDRVRLDRYRRALSEVVDEDSVVLDLGAGTGILGLLAASCGARRVYSVDDGPILTIAKQVAKGSRYADRVVHLRGVSTHLELPERVDVIVSDQIGGFVHDAGILGYYADAAARFMKPGGVLVPSDFTLRLTPVAGAELANCVAGWRRMPSGIDLSPISAVAVNTEHYVSSPVSSPLGPDVDIATIRSDQESPFCGEARLPITGSGWLCGLVGTFVARLSPSVTITNAPWANEPIQRWQNFYPIAEATEVAAGDHVDASIDVSPRTGMVAWRARIVRSGGTLAASFTHDTLQGSLAGPGAIMRGSDTWAPQPGARVELARTVLDALDGETSVAHLADLVCLAHPGRFVSARHARRFVRSVIAPLVDHSTD